MPLHYPCQEQGLRKEQVNSSNQDDVKAISASAAALTAVRGTLLITLIAMHIRPGESKECKKQPWPWSLWNQKSFKRMSVGVRVCAHKCTYTRKTNRYGEGYTDYFESTSTILKLYLWMCEFLLIGNLCFLPLNVNHTPGTQPRTVSHHNYIWSSPMGTITP